MRRRVPPAVVPGGPARVLVVSASMGAGHDGAARTLAEQVRQQGHFAEVMDFLQSGPLRIGSALRRGYEFELRHIPSAYGATYRMWYRVPWLCPAVAWLVTVLTRRRVLRWIARSGATVVVSTYPLATLCLGRLRRRGRLGVPVVNLITDFGVHPLWVHPGVDLNLAIHPAAAAAAAERSGRPARSCGPAVSERFDPAGLPPRAEARRRFGIPEGARAVLIVAGSWGVGDVAETYRCVAASGRFLPVVVCGRDESLRRSVEALAAGRETILLGWTDRMPALMAACDVLVENAGGLTSFEAMRAGLPVVSFHPIAGHGVDNTAAMHAAGVARLASDPADLARALADLTEPGPARQAQIARAGAIFRAGPAAAVLEVAAAPPAPAVAPAARGRRVAARLAAATVAVAGLSWTGLTTGVALATEAGAGVAHPPRGPGLVAYVGVRLTAADLADREVASELHTMGLTVVVDGATASAAATAVRSLAASGLTVDNGGQGEPPGPHHSSDTPWDRAAGDASAGRYISRLIDAPVTQTVTGRRLNAWDLIDCNSAHTAIVVPNHILHPEPGSPLHLAAGQIYLVDGFGATPAELAAFLAALRASAAAAAITPLPLATLA